ncbi:MAG: hypothetical protein IBX44_08555 [Sulfurospirillum sp.]|nr:hypothetical protein [Sulfurospirillum sp.]
MFTYNLLSYINRIKHEPQTFGQLFRDLECELEALAISMHLFLQILTNIANISDNNQVFIVKNVNFSPNPLNFFFTCTI